MSDNDITRVVEPEIKKMNPLDRLISLFISPVALMKNIKLYPVILVPLLIVTLLALGMLPFMGRYTEIQTRIFSNVSLERYGMDYFNLTPVDEEEETAQTVSTITNITTTATLLVSYPISAFFAALGLLILTKIARGQAKLGQYFSLYLHLFILSAIGAIITTSMSVMLDSTLDITSLAAIFMPLGNITMLVYNLFSSITVFNVWVAVLVIIGVKVINECSTVKAVIIGLISYLFSVAISTATLSMTFLSFDIMNGLLQQ